MTKEQKQAEKQAKTLQYLLLIIRIITAIWIMCFIICAFYEPAEPNKFFSAIVIFLLIMCHAERDWLDRYTQKKIKRVRYILAKNI